MIRLPYRDHIGGQPYAGPQRTWWIVTMRHDDGTARFAVYAGDEHRAARKVCARELAPSSAIVKVCPDPRPPADPTRYCRY